MEKKIKILVIGIVVLAVLWVLFGTNLTCDVNAIQGRQINNLIERANYCTVDSDCVISREFQCFGCYNLFNKDADLKIIRANIQIYYAGCMCQAWKCRIASQEEVVCENKKCVEHS